MKRVYILLTTLLILVFSIYDLNASSNSKVIVKTSNLNVDTLNQLRLINKQIIQLEQQLQLLETKHISTKRNEYKPFFLDLLEEKNGDALNSPIFVPGGYPKPIMQENAPVVNESKLSDKKDGEGNKNNDQVNQDSKDYLADGGGDHAYNDTDNSSQPYYYPPNNSTDVKVVFSVSSDYSYYVCENHDDCSDSSGKSIDPNPYHNASVQNIEIHLEGNGIGSYDRIQFCDNKFSKSGNVIGLDKDNGFVINDASIVINDNPKRGGYVPQYNYDVAVAYAILSKSDSPSTTKNIQFSFPASNCTKEGDNLSCILLAGKDHTVNL